jgi:hypothetical protein
LRPCRVADLPADAESTLKPRNARSTLTVDHAVTHYIVAQGAGTNDRHRPVALSGDTEDDFVFRRVSVDADLLRIAAGIGVSPAGIRSEAGVIGAAFPDRAPEAVPDRAPEAVPDRTPEVEPDRAPEAVPDRAPEVEPDRAPEAVPDRAPGSRARPGG